MKYLFTLIITCSFLWTTAADKPNVILVITDDQGYGDIAALGNDIIKTPNLDDLYHSSFRLRDFHAGTTCAPSRSGLMTGMDGHRAGVWHTISGCNLMREKFTAMPQVFKDNGYATAMYGKWHLGDAYPYLPEHRGFEETVVHGAGGIGQTPDYWNNDYFDDTYMHNGIAKKYEGYCTDVFFAEAMKFIEEKKDEPFFVYISTNTPHGPLNVPEKYYKMYEDETEITDKQKAFYGMITNIDDNMALLEKKLKKLKLTDNTILMFTTDNGTASGIEYVNGKEYGFNAGMKGKKGNEYDGGHRVPYFIRYNDGGINGGKDVEPLTMNYDIMPTVIDLCGLTAPAHTVFDGKSLAPLLKKPDAKWENRYAVVDNNRIQQPEKWRKCAVMDDQWRLINGKKLYNIHEDVGQKNDIAAKHPQKVIEMRAAYENWWEHVSKDFGRFEAYKIGGPESRKSVLTIHDLHSYNPIAWSQRYVRDPLSGKTPALGQGYWMIDILEEGYYEISLSRWPEESGLAFKDGVPQLNEKKPWMETMPASRPYTFKTASLDIDALHVEEKVDMNSNKVTFKVYLTPGRNRISANLTTTDDHTFSAFYTYFKQLN
ncbi:arylsulfatase [Bacteroidales bacterium]|nr:arylsulfatase [Bacteroidales bacterium]